MGGNRGMVEVKDIKPILFCTKDVQAITNREKTTTRRVIKLDLGLADTDKNDSSYLKIPDKYGEFHDAKDLCRYKVGDVLWVRETWQKGYKGNIDKYGEPIIEYIYKAREGNISVDKWCPSIHMPKEAARIFLKVTDVRVERLQEITALECVYEGVDTLDILENTPDDDFVGYTKGQFADHWDSMLNKEDYDEYSWEANPWVWVIEFEKVDVSVS